MLVQEVMTPAPITIGPDTTIAETMELLHAHSIRHLPVVEAGAVIGLVSDRDLSFLHSMPLLWASIGEADIASVLERPIKDVMKQRFLINHDVVTTRSNEPLSEAIEKLLLHRLTALPVLDAGDDTLVGILSYVDILTVVARTGH
jgi:acetoin utilization protein AcuB